MAKRPQPKDSGAPKQRRCAIYTRKSTEEGLDQEFNSLDAQREACAAYITSQRHEGWVMLPDHYDDGGFTGGNMDRPGLKQLLAEVKAGRVDVIVVYKVDRLTRALSDFAKIVDVLDAAGASFVSITQAFNTTSSMGRLTLNVLLSFAQFEREVISERVRDKIAASKRKGMWMGGRVPLGYDVVERKLVVNKSEAELVRHIMRTYLRANSVRELAFMLAQEKLLSKVQKWSSGRIVGGKPFGRGALYHLLSNRLYRGEIVHHDNTYPGEHDSIVEDDLWAAVQTKLEASGVDRKTGKNADEPSLLAGMVQDTSGRRLTPSHATKGGRRYRYYVTAEIPLDGRGAAAEPIRIPAGELEAAALDGINAVLSNPVGLISCFGNTVMRADDVSAMRAAAACLQTTLRANKQSDAIGLLQRCDLQIIIGDSQLDASVSVAGLAEALQLQLDADVALLERVPIGMRSTVVRRGREIRLVIAPKLPAIESRDTVLITLIANGYNARIRLFDETPLGEEDYSRRHLARMAKLSFLAPDIVAAILDGKQPVHLTARRLLRMPDLPIRWSDQRQLLGFA